MNEKIAIVITLILLSATISLPCLAQDVQDEPEKVRIRGAKIGLTSGFYYKGADELSKELYGAGNLMYGGYVGADVVWRLEVRFEISSFNDKGATSISKKEILFSMFQYMLGARFRILNSEKISPYIGAGLSPGSYKEEVPHASYEYSDKLEKSYYFEAGLYFRILGKLYGDFNIRQVKADVSPFDEEIHLGGTRAGFGIEYRF